MSAQERLAQIAWYAVFIPVDFDTMADLLEANSNPRYWLSLLGHSDATVALGAFVLWLRFAQPHDPQAIRDAIRQLPSALRASAPWVASPWLGGPCNARADAVPQDA